MVITGRTAGESCHCFGLKHCRCSKSFLFFCTLRSFSFLVFQFFNHLVFCHSLSVQHVCNFFCFYSFFSWLHFDALMFSIVSAKVSRENVKRMRLVMWHFFPSLSIQLYIKWWPFFWSCYIWTQFFYFLPYNVMLLPDSVSHCCIWWHLRQTTQQCCDYNLKCTRNNNAVTVWDKNKWKNAKKESERRQFESISLPGQFNYVYMKSSTSVKRWQSWREQVS